MKSAVSGPVLLAFTALFCSGCYMHLQGVETDVTARLQALEERVAALEQGSPTPVPPAVSSQRGGVTAAEFTESNPSSQQNSTAGNKPVGRIRLKEIAPPPTLRSGKSTPADDE